MGYLRKEAEAGILRAETMNSRDANKLTWLGKRKRVSRLGWAELSQSWKWDPGLRKKGSALKRGLELGGTQLTEV